MAENKTKATKGSVTEFINALPDEAKRDDAKKLAKMMQAATGEKAKMWGPSIIGFGSYRYKYESGREGDMPIIGFSPRKPAMVLYVGIGDEEYKPLLENLGSHTTGKGCLYIKTLADVNQAVLEKILAKSVTKKRAK